MRDLLRIRRWAQRKSTVQACLRCKSRKIKCSSVRPCDRCVSAGYNFCVNDGSSAENNDLPRTLISGLRRTGEFFASKTSIFLVFSAAHHSAPRLNLTGGHNCTEWGCSNDTWTLSGGNWAAMQLSQRSAEALWQVLNII